MDKQQTVSCSAKLNGCFNPKSGILLAWCSGENDNLIDFTFVGLTLSYSFLLQPRVVQIFHTIWNLIRNLIRIWGKEIGRMVFWYLGLLQYGPGIIHRDYEANNLQYVICEIKKNSKFTQLKEYIYQSYCPLIYFHVFLQRLGFIYLSFNLFKVWLDINHPCNQMQSNKGKCGTCGHTKRSVADLEMSRSLAFMLRRETGSYEIHWKGGKTCVKWIHTDGGTVSWRET